MKKVIFGEIKREESVFSKITFIWDSLCLSSIMLARKKTSALGWQILDCRGRINSFKSKRKEEYYIILTSKALFQL